MERKALAGLMWLTLVVSVAACDSLSEEECLKIRGNAYDIINDHARDKPHTCSEDADCIPSEWPGCPMPINSKNRDRIVPFKDEFDKGSCVEPPTECPETPLMYCKQGLCVKLHKAGEKGNVTK